MDRLLAAHDGGRAGYVAGVTVSTAPEHPRPLLTRARWTSLDGPWAFARDDDDRGLSERWYRPGEEAARRFDRTIVVPFPVESPAAGLYPGPEPAPSPRVVWYRRTFAAAPAPGRRALLHLGAVDHRCRVWVDGQLVAEHVGGHTPVTADVTDVLDRDDDGRVGAEHVVVVRAEDDPTDLGQPRGKQDWLPEPHAVWYHRTTGIWQTVWWEDVPATRVGDVRWRPRPDDPAVEMTVRLDGPLTDGLQVHLVLEHDGAVLADDRYRVTGPEVRRRLALPPSGPDVEEPGLLWSPEHPTLLRASVRLLAPDGAVVDEVGSYTALRDVATADGRFLLNGRPYFLRMVLAQNYWPASHLAAPDPGALEREARLAKGLGFNGVRVHQKVEDPRFLAWCDRVGLLVWAEMPSAYTFSTRTTGLLAREWAEVVERDAGHPCVVAWVPFNESWGVPALERSPRQQHLVRALAHLTRALDPDRPVVGNDGWENLAGDLVTVHDYAADGDVLRERYGDPAALGRTLHGLRPGHHRLLLEEPAPGAPVVVSECGGITHDPEAREGWHGYGAVGDPEQLLEGYRSLVGALLASTAVAGFCWTQLTDTGQERNGLLTADRVPKVDPARLRAVTAAPSAAVPGEAVHEGAHESSPIRDHVARLDGAARGTAPP